MKKIAILTDSVALPREEPKKHVLLEETWPYLLKNKLKNKYLIHQTSMGGATTDDLKNQLYYNSVFKPDIVIIQAGIVDCAPRALTLRENELLNNYKITGVLGKIILRPFTVFLRNYRKIAYVNIHDFKNNLRYIKKYFNHSKVYWITIANVSEEYNNISPGITSRIIEYNKLIREIYKEKSIEIKDLPKDGVMSDYHHLTKKGNYIIFTKIMNKIK